MELQYFVAATLQQNHILLRLSITMVTP